MDGEKELTLEENFRQIEEIIGLLEDDNIPLEKAFQAYGRGMGLLKRCNDQLDRVEKQVLKLTDGGQLKEFDYGETDV